MTKLVTVFLVAILGLIVLSWISAGWEVGLTLLLIEGQLLIALSGVGQALKAESVDRLLRHPQDDGSPATPGSQP